MLFRLAIIAGSTLLVAGCSLPVSAPQKDVSPLVQQFANTECRAVALREQRFALANAIRFTQDTLLEVQKSQGDTLRLIKRLEVINTEKEQLLAASRLLADSIHAYLDSLRSHELKDTATLRRFNEVLQDTLKRRGCLE